MTRFRYQPIDQERRSLRLVQLLAGDEGAIRCQLFDAWLDDPEGIIEYEALSYTWGDSWRAFDIELNGEFLPVTRNLWAALVALRHPTHDRILWIDAICINQDNEKERGHQVSQMALIYKRAEQVIVWLGPADKETDLIFDYMTALELESRSCPCNGWAASDKRWRDLSHEIPTKIHPEHQAAFQELLRRRWFARVWIIQEIANARAARIVCGTKSVAGRILAAFPFLLWDSPVLQCQAILDVMPGPTRESSWWCVNHSLSMLLRKFWSSEATDPRDRIYALLGISSDASNMKVIEPNYERDEKDVVHDTIGFLLRLGSLSISSRCLPNWTMEELFSSLEDLANEVLLHASENGHGALVLHILRTAEISLDYFKADKNSALHLASANGHHSIVQSLLNAGADPYTRNDLGWIPAWTAAVNQHEEVVELLSDQGQWHYEKLPLINNQPSYTHWLNSLLQAGGMDAEHLYLEMTPLCWAAKIGNIEIFRVIVNSTITDLNDQKVDELPLITWIVQHADEDIFACILNTDQVKSDQRPDVWEDLWQWAIQNHRAQVLNLMIDAGRTFTSRKREEDEREPPLTFAIRHGNRVIVEILLGQIKAGKVLVSDGQSALQLAVKMGNADMVRTLVNHQTLRLSPEAVSTSSALSTACEKGQEEIAKILLEPEDFVWPESTKSESLISAIVYGHIDIIKLLLTTKPFDLNWRNKDGRSALHQAAASRNHEALQILLDTDRVDVNAKDYENRTALYYAANRGASDLVACLVAIPGIELDTVATTSGWTPLATTRRPDVIEILLATRKVNPWRRDRHGQRAIDSFTNKPHLEAFKLLQAYMKSSDIIERFAVDAVADSPPIKIS